MKTITVKIDREGVATITTKGFTGGACLEATKGLEQALGGELLERKHTDEFYAEAEAEASTNVGS